MPDIMLRDTMAHQAKRGTIKFVGEHLNSNKNH
jgi:hypothetical protein